MSLASSAPHPQLLNTLLCLSSTIFFQPIVYNTFLVFECHGTWLHTKWTCYSGPHIALFLIVPILLGLYLALLIIGTTWSVCACVCGCIPPSGGRGRVVLILEL